MVTDSRSHLAADALSFHTPIAVNTTIYHNPRCSKSRSALELLRSRGIEPVVIEYLKHPPTLDELKMLLEGLELQPRELMRRSEAVYKELGLDDPELGEEQLLRAMVDNPILIERPIVVANGKVALGRPPERVLSIL
jgi:arsenate reductase